MSTERPSPFKPRPSAAGRARRGWGRKLLLAALLAGLAAVIAYGFWPKPIQVEAARLTQGPLTVSVLEEGKTRIRHRYVVFPPVAGFLRRVELRAGVPIVAGETVLAVLEPQLSGFVDPRARVQAEARVQAAEANKLLRQSELGRAKAALDLAQREFERINRLRESAAAASREWDTAENQVRVLTRDVHSAEFALQVAEFEIAQAQAALLPPTASQPTDSPPIRILAPIDGYVLNVYEESARVVQPSTQLMEVGDPRDLEAEIELFSSDAVAVAPGAEVSIEQWGGDEPLRARVSVVERGGFTKVSAIGVEEQRVKVRVDFLDPMPPGREMGDRFHVEARIVTWHADMVRQIPVGALFRRGSDWMAFAVEGGRARLRKVEVGHNSGTAAEIRSGLADDAVVIVHPPESITDGVAVAIDQGANQAGAN